MCVLFGKQAKALQEELICKVNECNKLRSELDEYDRQNAAHIAQLSKLQSAVAAMEKEVKETIKERNELKLQLVTKDNTIKNLRFELAKYEPKRDNKGRFSKKK